MRDGVLVTPLTPRCSFTRGGGICGSSRLFDGRLVAPSQALVAPSLDTSVRPRRGIRLSSIYHPAENHKFALRKGRGEAAERTRPAPSGKGHRLYNWRHSFLESPLRKKTR